MELGFLPNQVATVPGMTISIDCSDQVTITAPSTLSVSEVAFAIGSGLKVYEMEAFTTDDTNCPVISYTASHITGITQPDCSSPPDASQGCRKLTLDTSV
jgi:hypothetical protein